MKVFAVVSMVFLGLSSLAQDSKIVGAQAHYDRQEYADALADIDEALFKPETLSTELIPKAYLLRGKVLLRGCAKNMVLASELKTKYQDCYLQAFEDVKKARALSDKQKIQTQAANTFTTMNPFLMQTGLMCFQQYRKSNDMVLLDKAIAYYTASLEILDTGYNVHDLIGQAYLEKRDTTMAVASFERAIAEIEKNVHTDADFLAPYVFYKMALVYRNEEPLKALIYVKDGLAQVENERKKLENGKAPNVQQAGRGLDRTERDLKNFKLKSSSFETNGKENRADWKEASEKYPNDIKINYGYAMMLEKLDWKESVRQYEKVVAIDPQHQKAHFALAALCWNKVVSAKQAGEEVSKEQLELALLHFEKSFEMKPEKSSVQTILQITKLLELDDKYAEYSRKKKAYGF